MSLASIVGFALLLTLVVVEGVAIFALFRQVGLLHLTHQQEGQSFIEPHPGPDHLPDGAEAPVLAGHTVQGAGVALAQLFGQRVLLAFLHPDCRPCNEIGPDLQVLATDTALATRVIVVSEGDRLSTEAFIAEHQLTIPVLDLPRDDYSKRSEISERFRVTNFPFAYLLDEQHRIVASGVVGGKEFFWRVAKGESRGHSDGDKLPAEKFFISPRDAERVAAAMAGKGGAPMQEV